MWRGPLTAFLLHGAGDGRRGNRGAQERVRFTFWEGKADILDDFIQRREASDVHYTFDMYERDTGRNRARQRDQMVPRA